MSPAADPVSHRSDNKFNNHYFLITILSGGKLTIYWERCDICGRYHPLRQCTMDPELMVCVHCCIACPRREKCPNPVWGLAYRRVVLKKAAPKIDEKKKLLEELLSKLEK